MSEEITAEQQVQEAKAVVAAEHEQRAQSRMGALAAVPALQRELAGAIARRLMGIAGPAEVNDDDGVDSQTSDAFRDCLGSMIAARQLYAVGLRELSDRLENLLPEQRQQVIQASAADLVVGDLLESRLTRWFREDVEPGSQVMPYEQETYQRVAEPYLANDREQARQILSDALREELMNLDDEQVKRIWGAMNDLLLQSVMHQASKAFSEEMLFRGMRETVFPWLIKVTQEHTEKEETQQVQEAQAWEAARRERPIPLGMSVMNTPENDDAWLLTRDRPLVLVGWRPAVLYLLSKITNTVLVAKDDHLFTVIRLCVDPRMDEPVYRTHDRFFWLHSKQWADCGSAVDRWAAVFEQYLLRRRAMSSAPDLLICDDLVLAGKSAGLVGGSVNHKAGIAQKRLFSWCKKIGAGLIGGVLLDTPEELSDLGTIGSGVGGWQQLRDFTTLRVVSVTKEDQMYRVSVGNDLYVAGVAVELLDGIKRED